ncbi:DMT family protein [Legionella tunisiensis]|uniref:DMT family protein n=1 Tax=Legionella tunisiensis TaxID=1034944 RepID=UPI0018DDBD8F
MKTIFLLIGSNIFMTFAWYGHLKRVTSKPLYFAILVSWLSHFLSVLYKYRRIVWATKSPI